MTAPNSEAREPATDQRGSAEAGPTATVAIPR